MFLVCTLMVFFSEIFLYSNDFKVLAHFLSCLVHSTWFYIVAFDKFGLEFCAGRSSWIYYKMSYICRHPVRPASFVKDALLFQMCIFVFFTESGIHRCVNLYIGLQLKSIVFFYSNTMLFFFVCLTMEDTLVSFLKYSLNISTL